MWSLVTKLPLGSREAVCCACVPSFHNSNYRVQVECCKVLSAMATLELFCMLGKLGRDSGCRMLCEFLILIFFTGQIEGLLDDIDFKAKVSRQEFEDLCSDLFQRVPGPVQQALSSAEMNLVCLGVH